MADKASKGQKGAQEQSQINMKKTEGQEISESSIPKTITSSRQPLQADLSPLPIPPKSDNGNVYSFSPNYSFPNELQEIYTPIVKQSSRFMGIQDSHVISSKIIFESKSEDGQNDSSEYQSEEEEQQCSQKLSSLKQQLPFSSPLRQSQKQIEQPSQDFSNVIQNQQAYKRRTSKPHLSTKTPKQTHPKKKIHCNCKKTLCLKLYCDCFRINEKCEGCNCQGCHNTQVYSEQRNKAILSLMDRNPDPFAQKIQFDHHLKGCNCKKSSCLKKYCQCYQAGLRCGINCKCEQCKNMQCAQVDKREGGGQKVVVGTKATAKKQKRMVEI